jgi:hypothetical protein
MAGNILARAIIEGDPTWRQFTPFELVWAGGVLGRTAAQARVLFKRLCAAIDGRRAKAREAARRQKGGSGAVGAGQGGFRGRTGRIRRLWAIFG